MSNKAKQLPMIVKAPIYIAGILFGIFVTRYCIDQFRDDSPAPAASKEISVVREVKEVRANLSEVKSALESHYMDYNKYPNSLRELAPGRFKKTPLSYCGEPYSYSLNSDQKSYTLRADGC